jgi:pyruvate/2-oxoacid:ferredoxin oxidoreductase beta subunit
MRRGVNMTYIVENNGVYGLTKGQFSATADRGSKAKRGAINTDEGIDLVLMALQLGATYVARSFLRRQGPARAAHQGRAHARGRRVPGRDLARASPSTTTTARPRATTTCASTTRR